MEMSHIRTANNRPESAEVNEGKLNVSLNNYVSVLITEFKLIWLHSSCSPVLTRAEQDAQHRGADDFHVEQSVSAKKDTHTHIKKFITASLCVPRIKQHTSALVMSK